jgi:hypothetical protein
MNNQVKIFEEITALVDNELNDTVREQFLLNSIKNDVELNSEYQIQSSIKNLVGSRLSFVPTPGYLSARIKNQIREEAGQAKFSLKDYLSPYFRKPVYAIPAAAAIILFLIIFQLDSSVNISASDMFAQAEYNFNSIINGELKPQKLCNNSREVKNFFTNSGVTYATVVPEFSDWHILGAVVSNENGEKLAHHVYADNSGHIIYLYQVSENQLTEKKLLELSPYLLNKCKTKRFVKFNSESHSTYLFIHNNNVFALVTNDEDAKIEKNFIANLINDQTL